MLDLEDNLETLAGHNYQREDAPCWIEVDFMKVSLVAYRKRRVIQTL